MYMGPDGALRKGGAAFFLRGMSGGTGDVCFSPSGREEGRRVFLERHAVRLMRLFGQQAEALKRYRRDATQIISVQHMAVDKALIGCDIPQHGGHKSDANNSQ